MVNALLGRKLEMSTRFDEKGRRVPVTLIEAGPCPVVQVKTLDTDGYWAVQLGFGQKKLKRTPKPILGHAKKAGLDRPPHFFREVRLFPQEGVDLKGKLPKRGEVVKVEDVFKPGDLVKITGTSKGKGFAGVVKRWGFAGGPASHGQSDRERAPGSIGATTSPGRVLRGKKMAGHMGARTVTVSGITVMDLEPEKNLLVVKGQVPGARNSLLVIKQMGKAKRFVPLIKEGQAGEGKKEPAEKVVKRKSKSAKSKKTDNHED